MAETKPIINQSTAEQPKETTETSSREGFGPIKEAWKGSLVVKILSVLLVAIIVLLFVFFGLMIAYSNEKSDYVQQNDGINQKIKLCESERKGYKNELDTCKSEGDSLQRQITDLQNQKSQLTKDLDQAKKDLEAKVKEVNNCNNELGECKNNQDALQRQLTECQNTQAELNKQIADLKNQVSTKDKEIKKLKDDIYYYQLVAIGSAVVHVGVGIESIITHTSWSACEGNLQHCQGNLTTCEGELTRCRANETDCRKKIVDLDKELQECNTKEEKCRNDYAICNEELRKEEQVIFQLLHQISKMPLMAVEQAMLHELLKETNYSFSATMKYNGSHDGYHKSDFVRQMGEAAWSVLIVRGKDGEVYGGFSTSKWVESGSWTEDRKAFLFVATPFKYCEIQDKTHAIDMGHEFVKFGGEFVVSPSNGKTTSGYYECKSLGAERIELDIIDMYGFEVILHHNPSNSFKRLKLT
jgi:peptidoglycan hydrolase CwlO-like protein